MDELVLVRAWEVPGVDFPEPFKRRIRVLIAPDLNGVDALMASEAILAPFAQTDMHRHEDRGELIYIVSGRGEIVTDGDPVPIQPDVIFWVPPRFEHGIRNTGPETLKLLAVFVPPMTAEENYDRARRAVESARDGRREDEAR